MTKSDISYHKIVSISTNGDDTTRKRLGKMNQE